MNTIKNNDQVDFVRGKYKLSDDGLKVISISTNVEMKLKTKNSIAVYIEKEKKYSYNISYIRSLLKDVKFLSYDNDLISVFCERFSLSREGSVIRLSDNKNMNDGILPVRFTVKNKGYRMPLFMAINILSLKDAPLEKTPVGLNEKDTPLKREGDRKALYKNPISGKRAFDNTQRKNQKIKSNFDQFKCMLKGEEKIVYTDNIYEIGFLFLLRNQSSINKNFK